MEVMYYAKGISWIDDCRIPWQNDLEFQFIKKEIKRYGYDPNKNQNEDWAGIKKIGNVSKEKGRFPANILVSDDMLNDGVISKSQKGIRIIEGRENVINPGGWKEVNRTSGKISGFDNKGSNSRYYDIDKWFNDLLEL